MFTKHISRKPLGQDDNATMLLLYICRVTILLLCSLFFTSRDCRVISHTLYKLLEKETFYSILLVRQGSVERGNVWKNISEVLNVMEQPLFKVNERSTRDRLNFLMKKFKRIDNEEKRASGIKVEEEGELDKGLQGIVKLLDNSEKILKEENAAKKQKLEMMASQAEELRLNSLETFSQTKARKGEESSSEEPKKRRSSNDMIGFFGEKNAQENEFRQQELDLKRQEMQNFQTLMANQQQETNLLMQQQQQMNVAFLNILGKFLPSQNPPN